MLFDRVARRKDSASDADKKVLQKQFQAIQEEQRREEAMRHTDSGRPPNKFRELNWHIINAEQPVSDMVHGAVVYIHQEHQRPKYRPQPKRNRNNHINPAFPQP